MGPAYVQVSSTENHLLKAHEIFVKSQYDANKSESEEMESRFRLMLLMNQLDVQLLSTSLQHLAKCVSNCFFFIFLHVHDQLLLLVLPIFLCNNFHRVTRLTPHTVDREFELLKSFAGYDNESCCLENIEWVLGKHV